mmetsp:Transcript_4616/g.8747  ORF Transcript_4616/g.8747 Transcript_4616/m.8747 type:complete len:344 (+) Transcript_4616:222-1253(+)|eukprot:CAMPEP_0114265660 /NCGR_PEP_ID=MMETSP0058-20121206/24068_1 /TAXON_ID=36894 /ORGANISM="Pyramimonas parkeae, CCMP726" /LENGTH=343 /DNA_ID=CAMNT_0001382835 /DNA_START=221 /DNA_END=1252 /DNA_ORIENTATION=-
MFRSDSGFFDFEHGSESESENEHGMVSPGSVHGHPHLQSKLSAQWVLPSIGEDLCLLGGRDSMDSPPVSRQNSASILPPPSLRRQVGHSQYVGIGHDGLCIQTKIQQVQRMDVSLIPSEGWSGKDGLTIAPDSDGTSSHMAVQRNMILEPHIISSQPIPSDSNAVLGSVPHQTSQPMPAPPTSLIKQEELLTTECMADAAAVFPELPAFPRGLSVLIIDDDQTSGPVNARMLQTQGYEVTCAGSLDEAGQLLQRAACSFHVVIASHATVGSMVNTLAELSSLPVILMSQAKGLTEVAKSVMQGCIGCIGKPIREQDLSFIWRSLLSSKTGQSYDNLSAVVQIL